MSTVAIDADQIAIISHNPLAVFIMDLALKAFNVRSLM